MFFSKTRLIVRYHPSFRKLYSFESGADVQAIEEVVRLKRFSVEPLVWILNHAPPIIASRAAVALAKIADSDSLSALKQAISKSEEDVLLKIYELLDSDTSLRTIDGNLHKFYIDYKNSRERQLENVAFFVTEYLSLPVDEDKASQKSVMCLELSSDYTSSSRGLPLGDNHLYISGTAHMVTLGVNDGNPMRDAHASPLDTRSKTNCEVASFIASSRIRLYLKGDALTSQSSELLEDDLPFFLVPFADVPTRTVEGQVELNFESLHECPDVEGSALLSLADSIGQSMNYDSFLRILTTGCPPKKGLFLPFNKLESSIGSKSCLGCIELLENVTDNAWKCRICYCSETALASDTRFVRTVVGYQHGVSPQLPGIIVERVVARIIQA